MNFKYTRDALQYIIDHEKEDFIEQCEDNGLSYDEGLTKLDNHVYYAAQRGMVELDNADEHFGGIE